MRPPELLPVWLLGKIGELCFGGARKSAPCSKNNARPLGQGKGREHHSSRPSIGQRLHVTCATLGYTTETMSRDCTDHLST